MRFMIVNSLAELVIYERDQGYIGHDNVRYMDRLEGDDDPTEYPVMVYTNVVGRDNDDRLIYNRAVITPDMAWNLIIAKAESNAAG